MGLLNLCFLVYLYLLAEVKERVYVGLTLDCLYVYY